MAAEGNHAEPRLLIPALKPLYTWTVPLSWLVVRVGVASQLVLAGWDKIGRARAPAELMKKFPDMPPETGYRITFVLLLIELVGGSCIILGLFTRFFAAAAAIEMAVLTFYIYGPNGYAWRHDGYQFVLMWGLMLFAIALRGGGPFSLDRLIGREL